jgi:hypothetical protein
MAPDSETVPAVGPTIASVSGELVRLERDFHQPPPGTSLASLEHATVDDFWEVGASGRRYDRTFVLKELDRRLKNPGVNAWTYSDAQCRQLAPDIFLLTYSLVQDNGRLTRRSTIWQHFPEGWKMVFHQGTVVQDQDIPQP